MYDDNVSHVQPRPCAPGLRIRQMIENNGVGRINRITGGCAGIHHQYGRILRNNVNGAFLTVVVCKNCLLCNEENRSRKLNVPPTIIGMIFDLF